MANTLAYYDTATITAVKSFIVQAPGFIEEEKSLIILPSKANVIKLIGYRGRIFSCVRLFYE